MILELPAVPPAGFTEPALRAGAGTAKMRVAADLSSLRWRRPVDS